MIEFCGMPASSNCDIACSATAREVKIPTTLRIILLQCRPEARLRCRVPGTELASQVKIIVWMSVRRCLVAEPQSVWPIKVPAFVLPCTARSTRCPSTWQGRYGSGFRSVDRYVALRFYFGSLLLLPLLFRPTRRVQLACFWDASCQQRRYPNSIPNSDRGAGSDDSLPCFPDGHYSGDASRWVGRVCLARETLFKCAYFCFQP
jgi:hypothetical protein